MRKAALLDLDGTLIDSTQAHAHAWMRAFDRFGYQVPAERIRRWVGMGADKLLRQVDSTLSDQREPGKTISLLHQELYMSEYVRTLRATNGAREFLQRLGEEELLRVIASSAEPNEISVALKAADIEDLVDVTMRPEEARRSKPDPDIVIAALRKTGVAPDEAAYVGDTPYDIEAAHGAGVIAIALTTGAWTAAELRDADAVYRDPSDLVQNFAQSPLGRIAAS